MCRNVGDSLFVVFIIYNISITMNHRIALSRLGLPEGASRDQVKWNFFNLIRNYDKENPDHREAITRLTDARKFLDTYGTQIPDEPKRKKTPERSYDWSTPDFSTMYEGPKTWTVEEGLGMPAWMSVLIIAICLVSAFAVISNHVPERPVREFLDYGIVPDDHVGPVTKIYDDLSREPQRKIRKAVKEIVSPAARQDVPVWKQTRPGAGAMERR